MYSSDLIIKRIKADLKNPANKIEGSLGADNAHAVGKELARLYDYVDYVNDMHFVDTAEGKWLDKKAEDYGLIRKGATNSSGYVTFYGQDGTVINAGVKIYSDNLSFSILEGGKIEGESVRLLCQCDTPGIVGNVPELAVYDFKRLKGIREIISEEFTGGVDVESDEAFRERLLLKIRYPGTSGNCYHYMHWALEVEGVGRVKIYPLWNGNGTVKVSILDSNNSIASEELIKAVKDHIDPDNGHGTALAPIGATLTVSTAIREPINIAGSIVYKSNSSVDEGEIRRVIEEYFRELSYSGDPYELDINEDYTLVSYAKVIDLIMSIEGVLDVSNLTLNGQKDSIKLIGEKIPSLGEVVF